MKGIADLEYQGLLRSVGTHRNTRPLSPVEVAELLGKAVAAGATRSECAQALGIGPSQISAFFSLLQLAPPIRHLADWQGSKAASIAFSTMAELRRLQRDDQVVAAGNPIGDCVTQVLNLRPQIITRHLFVGAVTNPEIRPWLDTMPQNDRDRLPNALRKLTGINYQTNVRLGANEFTVLSDHDLPTLLGLQPNDIETSINQILAEA